jgi:hypothetical protein
MAVFLVMGSSADGVIKNEKRPRPSPAGPFWVKYACFSARNQQAIRRKRSPWSSMPLIEACSSRVYGGKAPRRQRLAWRRRISMTRRKINTHVADDLVPWSGCQFAQQRLQSAIVFMSLHESNLGHGIEAIRSPSTLPLHLR